MEIETLFRIEMTLLIVFCLLADLTIDGKYKEYWNTCMAGIFMVCYVLIFTAVWGIVK